MGEISKIAWTDATFNPWWGCQRVSPGCGLGKSVGGCYAEAFAKRTGHNVWGPQSPRRFFGDKHWSEPLKWNKRAEREERRMRVFCASMADVFEDRRDLDSQRERLWSLIGDTPMLDWLLLTKRPENMLRFGGWRILPNVWAGVTAENQHYYDLRWPLLAEATRSAASVVTFISHEPAIGPLMIKCHGCGHDIGAHLAPDQGGCSGWLPSWIITGGESGGGPRPYNTEWARSVIRQCKLASIPCFVKQLGDNAWNSDPMSDLIKLRLRGSKGGDWEEWPEDLRVRQFPRSSVYGIGNIALLEQS